MGYGEGQRRVCLLYQKLRCQYSGESVPLQKAGLNPDTYTISIPLGATINMAGASITISVLALAAAHTLGLAIDLPTAFLLCIVSSIGACGTSGVAGGSLLLIPVACASFGIGNDISMQVVAVGFIISVLEDACETALNSSSDVLFTATAEFADRRKKGTFGRRIWFQKKNNKMAQRAVKQW